MPSKLQQFVAEVDKKTSNKTSNHADSVQVSKGAALAARDYIKGMLDGASRGGRGKSPLSDVPRTVKARERMRKLRERKQTENKI